MTSLSPVLTGTRILITAQRRASDLALALARRGADVDVAATLGVESHIDEATLLRHTTALIDQPADIVVITTGIGFRSWLDTAEANGLGDELVDALNRSRLIARGPKARGALQAAGLAADWVAESETSREIADFLVAEGIDGQRVVIQRHGAGDDGLATALTEAGADTTGLVIYRWGPPPDPIAVERSVADLRDGLYDAVVFTSAPGAAAWLDAVRDGGAWDAVVESNNEGRLLVAAVGPVTAEPLRVAGLDVLIPARGRLGALVRAVIMALGDDESGIETTAGRLRLHATSMTLDHQAVALSPTSLSIIRLLASDPGVVFSRVDVLSALPGDSTDPHTAEVAIARLREAMGGADCPVRTVVKRGYRLALAGSEGSA